jgi:hypothetical protein
VEGEEDTGNGNDTGADDQEDGGEDMGGYREEEEQGGANDDEGEDDFLPDSPTASYRPGGLGVGSHFFNADDLRCGRSLLPSFRIRMRVPLRLRVAGVWRSHGRGG